VLLRETILEKSRQILIKEGFGNLSMRKIASALDVSATALYSHFKGKDDLLVALIEESVEMLLGQLAHAAERETDAISRLKQMALAYVQFGLERPQEYEIMFVVRSEEMPRYPKEKFRKVRSAYSMLADTIREGHLTGMIEEPEPELAAYSIWAQLHGVVSVILNQRLDAKVSREEFVEHSVDHIIDGFVVRRQPV